MSRVGTGEEGNLIAATEDGDAYASVGVTTEIEDDILAYDIPTEAAVASYVQKTAITPDDIVKYGEVNKDVNNASNEKVVSEKAAVDLITINTLEEE